MLACAGEPRVDAAPPAADRRPVRIAHPAVVNPFIGTRLYVWPNSAAQRQVERWRRQRPDDAARINAIASQPQAIWFGDWTRDVRTEVRAIVADAARQKTLPVLVAYNIPHRDCGGHASGGARSAEDYRRWIAALAEGIGDHQAVVVLEPDGTAELQCLDPSRLEQRYELLRSAVQTLEENIGTSVYIDAGNALWIAPDEMANRLMKAGLAAAQGFALNVSNFVADSITREYGERIAELTGAKHFIIDSGRNGRGARADAEWCNPHGRGLGRRPSAVTERGRLDAYLWIKPPGESDGSCNGGPPAGEWWAEYALGLVLRAAHRM